MVYTHVSLLAAVRRYANVPNSSASGTATADIIAHANGVLRTELVPLILKLGEDYYLEAKSQAVTAGTASYRLPSRAVGAKLNDVGMKDSQGEFRSLVRIAKSELGDFAHEDGFPEAFYFEGAKVVLVPPPISTSETLEIPYYIRPNELVTTAYGTITAINTSTGAVTYTATGTYEPTTSSVVDLVAGTSPFECLAIDQTPTAAGVGTVTFSSLPSALAVGDYVCTYGQAPVPQAPEEFHELLYVKTARRLAQSLGATSRIQYLEAEERKLEEMIRQPFVPRVDGEPKMVGGGPNYLLGEG